MQKSVALSATRLSQQFHQLDLLSNNQANASTPGFRARESGWRGGEFQSWLNLSLGEIENTGSTWHVALPEGSYLQVMTPGGARFTRRADLEVGLDGQVTVGGMPVCDESGAPLRAPGADSLNSDGTLMAGASPQGKLGRFSIAKLRESGDWLTPEEGQAVTSDLRPLVGRCLEGSNVDSTREQTNLVALLRRSEVLGQVLHVQDQVLDKTIREVGRGR
jgi:flagellar basal-body rod protein FlgF